MVIQTNILAMNANRQFGLTQVGQKKSTEKLSSGYKINRAADDAAGLTISETMRRQIRGLNQASDNAQDGISMIQTAEGALNEVHDMLHRIDELCVQAANGTMTYEDRSAIQDEIYQLTDEIDRVGDATEFNTIKLLSGLPQPKATAVSAGVKVNGSSGTVTQATYDKDATYKIKQLVRGDTVAITSSGTKYYKAATNEDIQAYEKEWSDYYAKKAAYDADPYAEGAVEPTKPILRDGSSAAKAQLMEIPDINSKIAANLQKANETYNKNIADEVYVDLKNSSEGVFNLHFYGDLPVSLQVGSEKDHTISFKIKVINTGSLGMVGINVRDTDGSGAREGMDMVKNAVAKTSRERSKLGAIQNRIEHTIKNLDNVVENTQAAESLIRDTDMASEMVNYSNANIIAQASQSMIAQANQSTQGVLNLLG